MILLFSCHLIFNEIEYFFFQPFFLKFTNKRYYKHSGEFVHVFFLFFLFFPFFLSQVIREMPQLQPYWAAGFSFSRGHFKLRVPYDAYQPMVFQVRQFVELIIVVGETNFIPLIIICQNLSETINYQSNMNLLSSAVDNCDMWNRGYLPTKLKENIDHDSIRRSTKWRTWKTMGW